MHGIGAWVVHGILAGPAGPCKVHSAWHRCFVELGGGVDGCRVDDALV